MDFQKQREEFAAPAHRRIALVLTIMIVISVLVIGSMTRWSPLPIAGIRQVLNDQAGYVSVARHLVDGHGLTSSIIYPSTLAQHAPRNTLYMPGYYYLLATSYFLFGYSSFSSLLPSLAGYLLSIWLVYWLGVRLYGRLTGIVACSLFAFFPAVMLFAFSAMAELPVIASGVLAVCVFLLAPRRVQVLVGAAAIAVPLFFRETGAVVGVIILALLLMQSGKPEFRRASLCALLMLIVGLGLLHSPVAAGRPSLWDARILTVGDTSAIYADAFAFTKLDRSPKSWAIGIARNTVVNLKSVVKFWGRGRPSLWEMFGVFFLLSGIPLGFYRWLRTQDALSLGTAASLGLLLVADLCCYMFWGFHALRAFLVMLPFVTLLWAVQLQSVQTRTRSLPLLAIVVWLAFGMGTVLVQAKVDLANPAGKQNAAFLESIQPDPNGVLVSPWWLSLEYMNDHYPANWAYPPANCETLRLLDERYKVSTFVEVDSDVDPPLLAPGESCGLPLAYIGKRVHNGLGYSIFKRSSPVDASIVSQHH